MATYTLKRQHERLISRLSGELSAALGRRVSKTEVLESILDVVIEEEELFSTKEKARSFFSRHISNVEKREEKGSLLTSIRSLLVSLKP